MLTASRVERQHRLVSRGGAVDNSYTALRLLPRDTDAYVSQTPLAAHPPSLRREMRAAGVHLSGLHVFERLPAVLHHPREPTCRVCDPVAGPLGLGCTYSLALLRTPCRRSTSISLLCRGTLGYVPPGPSGLAPMHSTRAEVFSAASFTPGVASPARSKSFGPVFFWLSCTLHPPLLRDEHSDLRIRPPIHALGSILHPPLFPPSSPVAYLLNSGYTTRTPAPGPSMYITFATPLAAHLPSLRTPWRFLGPPHARCFLRPSKSITPRALTPTSSPAAHASGVKLGGHPLREASRVDIQLGVVLPWCSVRSSCSDVGIWSEIRAAGVHLSGLYVFFELLPAVLHHPREPTCRVCDPVAGPLGWAHLQSRALRPTHPLSPFDIDLSLCRGTLLARERLRTTGAVGLTPCTPRARRYSALHRALLV
ncbi:hypothetical protein B0H13DRAFT_2505345 [Mycena leptocephala]|nr:hypothetical protein B0H13DRAFT_2505345 [Mycena leptocephala]